MFVLPVLDLLNGVVVRGVAGRRDEYRPIESAIAKSPRPLDVARAFRASLGLTELYLADLDAIVRHQPAWDTYQALQEDGFSLWIDAGLCDVASAERLLSLGTAAVILGLETWRDPDSLNELCRHPGGDRLVFSLDLKAGVPLADPRVWDTADPFAIGQRVMTAGIRRMIVLDLAGVGTGEGLKTLELCRRLRVAAPSLQLVTGGGVRGPDDLRLLSGESLDGVLVASALHDGRISRQDLQELLTDQSRRDTIPPQAAARPDHYCT